MLLKDQLIGYNLILGSASPRRRELLESLAIPFSVDSGSNTPEIIDPTLPLLEVAPDLSRQKSEGFHRSLARGEILLTADTVVICGQEIMGKPKDEADASRMLHALSGCSHLVCTGCTLREGSRSDTFSAVTEVSFRELSDEEIDYYIRNYRPFDKAGAYGIQEWIGSVGLSGIKGSFYNVMGLPVRLVHDRLKTFIP